MPFTVEDFRDLLRLLEQHPEWRTELRRWVLSEELLRLPQLVQELVEAQRRSAERLGRTEEQIGRLTQAQESLARRLDTLTQRVEALAQAQDTLTRRVDTLTQHLDTLTRRVDTLTQHLDTLTRRVDDLTRRVDTLTQRVDTLTQHLDTLTQRVDDLTRRVDTLTQHLDTLTQQMHQLTRQTERLADVQTRMAIDLERLKGSDLERRYRERAHAYFSRLLRRAAVLSGEKLALLLDEAVSRGELSDEEADQILQADIVIQGKRRDTQQEVYAIVEVSWGVGVEDVERASERAALLARLGLPTVPVVAGTWITPDAVAVARAKKVWQVTDGRLLAPEESTAGP